MRCAFQDCPWPNKEITRDQSAYRIEPDIIVHYRICAPSIENAIHVTGRKVVLTRRGLRVATLVILIALLAPAYAEVNAGRSETDVRGCLCKYNSSSGKVDCRTPFIKTADKEHGNEDGEPEIWGYMVEDIGKYEHEPDKNGLVKPVNVLAARFIPADGQAHDFQTGRTERKVKCECWDQAPTVSAAQ